MLECGETQRMIDLIIKTLTFLKNTGVPPTYKNIRTCVAHLANGNIQTKYLFACLKQGIAMKLFKKRNNMYCWNNELKMIPNKKGTTNTVKMTKQSETNPIEEDIIIYGRYQ